MAASSSGGPEVRTTTAIARGRYGLPVTVRACGRKTPARAGADGSYELRVSQPGRYRRLVLSRLQAAPDKEPLPPAIIDELKQYLSDPAATLGERAWSWQPQTLDATKNPAVDQVF